MSFIVGTKQSDSITEAGISAGVTGGPTGPSGDFVFGDDGDDLISTGDGGDLALGGNGQDTLDGGGGNDALSGDNGDDSIDGGAGNDVLFGHRGDDHLHGGLGFDGLIGGAGGDVFAFGTLIDSRTASVAAADTGVGTEADIIVDFQQGSDVIDLSVLNQRFLPVGNFDVDFTFLGTDPFDGQVGVRYEIQNGRTIIQMDGSNVAGSGGTDQVADAEIVLIGEYHLTANDFIL